MSTPAPLPAADAAAARAAAARWLAAHDDGDHAAAWHASAPQLQARIDAPDLAALLRVVSLELGARRERTLRSTRRAVKLRDLPDGEYCLLEYRARVDDGTVDERVTVTRTADGEWRVAGYHIIDRS